MTALTFELKPSRPFSRPVNLATPFCKITFPLCKCPCAGNPRSLKNNKASNICRPNLCTCDKGKHVDFFVYFRFHGSFHCD